MTMCVLFITMHFFSFSLAKPTDKQSTIEQVDNENAIEGEKDEYAQFKTYGMRKRKWQKERHTNAM